MSIPKITSYELPAQQDYPQNKVNWQLDASKAVLLIHDMQEYFVNFYGSESQLIHEVVGNIEALKGVCKAAGIPVVYTAQPTNQSAADRALLNDMWGPGLTEEQAQYPVVESISPDEDDKVLQKWRYSAFQRSELEGWMKSQGRDQLLLCGVYTHIGVMTSAVDAFMRDIKPFLVADATADFSKEEHQFALHFVARRCGMVLPLHKVQNEVQIDMGEKVAEKGDLLSYEGLKTKLLSFADCEEDEFDPGENLMDFGVDSVQIMALHAEYQQLGVEMDLAEISDDLTMANIWSLIEQSKQGQ